MRSSGGRAYGRPPAGLPRPRRRAPRRVLVKQVVAEGGLLRIVASTASTISASCPARGVLSRRRHSGCERRLADGAVGCLVFITLTVRRLFCDNPGCARVTFAEQVDGLTVRYGRRTPQLTGLLGAIAVVLAGRAGERLAIRLPASVSDATLLSLAMALDDPYAQTPRVLGVDDSPPERATSTAPCWSTARPMPPSTCWPTGRRRRSRPGSPTTPEWRSSAATRAAPSPTAPAPEPPSPSRSPMCGISGITSPRP